MEKTRYLVAVTTESGYILGLGAVWKNGSRWLRWFSPNVKDCMDYPRAISYPTRREARNHARSVLRWAKNSGVLDKTAKSKIIPVYDLTSLT